MCIAQHDRNLEHDQTDYKGGTVNAIELFYELE